MAQQANILDVLIVGGGIAGLSAALAADKVYALLHPGNRPAPQTGTRFRPAS